MVGLGWGKGQICLFPTQLPPPPTLGGEKRGKGGERFKSALSPLFMVGLGWGKGQICLSPLQQPPPSTFGGGEGGKVEGKTLNQFYLPCLW